MKILICERLYIISVLILLTKNSLLYIYNKLSIKIYILHNEWDCIDNTLIWENHSFLVIVSYNSLSNLYRHRFSSLLAGHGRCFRAGHVRFHRGPPLHYHGPGQGDRVRYRLGLLDFGSRIKGRPHLLR